ncbi:conserved protein of unknown function [Burkholderia multivorans]
MRADAVIDTLMSIRELPAKIAAALSRVPQSGAVRRFGLDAFTVLRRDDHELSLGLVGRFWRPDFGLRSIRNADEFIRHDDAKDAKLVLRFRVTSAPRGGSILETETFVYCPSGSVKLLFTPYWLAIRLASGWIRQRTLNAVERSFGTSH